VECGRLRDDLCWLPLSRRVHIIEFIALSRSCDAGEFMAMRDSWVEKREAEAGGENGGPQTCRRASGAARRRHEEMQYVQAEKLEPELVRGEIARGRAIIPRIFIIGISNRWALVWRSLQNQCEYRKLATTSNIEKN